MSIDLTQIIVALIGLMGAIITGFLIPYIKQKTTKEQQQTISLVIQTAVQAAEQIFNGTGLGVEKKKWVIEYLVERGYVADIDEIDASIDAQIEAMVYQLKTEK